jgi:hypothetical protein
MYLERLKLKTMDSELERDLSLFNEKHSYFRGDVKIPLSFLKFEDQKVEGARTLDRENVLRLINIFETEGCYRLEPEHYISALISQETLDKGLRKSNLTQAGLLDYQSEPPELLLDDDSTVVCLYGQHRIEAGKAYLALREKWWVVRLYLDSKLT